MHKNEAVGVCLQVTNTLVLLKKILKMKMIAQLRVLLKDCNGSKKGVYQLCQVDLL